MRIVDWIILSFIAVAFGRAIVIAFQQNFAIRRSNRSQKRPIS